VATAQPNPAGKALISYQSHRLEWAGTGNEGTEGELRSLKLSTNRGDIVARYHLASAGAGGPVQAGVVWVGGAGGGLDGPAGVYPVLCETLQRQGIAGLRLHYRQPNVLEECVLDTLLGVKFLQSEGVEHIALVGWSFGGAVVIQAGASSSAVKAVVTFASQTYGVKDEAKLSPRALLLLHGTADTVLPDTCSRRIYSAARQPKELKLYPGAGHGFTEVRADAIRLLTEWLPPHLNPKR
jgi:hypothetical protein